MRDHHRGFCRSDRRLRRRHHGRQKKTMVYGTDTTVCAITTVVFVAATAECAADTMVAGKNTVVAGTRTLVSRENSMVEETETMVFFLPTMIPATPITMFFPANVMLDAERVVCTPDISVRRKIQRRCAASHAMVVALHPRRTASSPVGLHATTTRGSRMIASAPVEVKFQESVIC
jgi:hypothetical protein